VSWDIFVQDFPRHAVAIADIPDDFESAPLGPRDEIVKKILEVVPTANFTDPTWGTIERDGWSIEVNIGAQQQCQSFAFHVRGGDEAAGAIAAILEHLNLRALDSQTGEFFAPGPTALASFRRWRAYRHRVTGKGE
jgi:hypothetical protein